MLILRAETGPSLALTMVVALVLAMLVFALRTVLSSEDMKNPTVTVTEVVLSEGDRETLDLIESEAVREVQVAEVDSPSEPGPDTPSVTAVAAGKEGLRTAPGLEADTAAIDNAVDQALGDLEDARTGLKQARKKSDARKKALAAARATAAKANVQEEVLAKLGACGFGFGWKKVPGGYICSANICRITDAQFDAKYKTMYPGTP